MQTNETTLFPADTMDRINKEEDKGRIPKGKRKVEKGRKGEGDEWGMKGTGR